MDKKIFESAEMMITRFSSDEVICASVPVITRDPDAPIELPFVPAG